MENPKNKLSYISVPSPIIHQVPSSSLQGLLLSPKKSSRPRSRFLAAARNTGFLVFLCLFAFVGMLKLSVQLDPLVPLAPIPCATPRPEAPPLFSSTAGDSQPATPPSGGGDGGGEEFWEQPDGMGYRPCLDFSKGYRRATEGIKRDRNKYLVVGVSGGLNQQRNQIVDAVVIARILGAALVVPVLQVNIVWGDESEFGDIFDLEHFKRVLANDVRVVSSLPTTHLTRRPVEQLPTPPRVSDRWIRSKYLKRLTREGVLVLRGFDSRLSKDLPSDLQKLRCKVPSLSLSLTYESSLTCVFLYSQVAFDALRFSAPVRELGNRLAMRMRSRGPYIALHLRMEKDVWVRTGCFPGLSPEYDDVISRERESRPELLTGKTKMRHQERKAAGLCPLTIVEVTRLLKALGAPRRANIFWAGGEPFGGGAALLPLVGEFPYLYNKYNLSSPGELDPFANRSSILAAVDFIIAEKSDVFMPSHGGNMGRILKGHRAFAGHKKFITPNKRQMVPHFLNASLPEAEFIQIIRELHNASLGQPELRTDKVGKDVTAYPIPECMCNTTAPMP
ncbi:unnamed protein product [Spirodela intermedia]|uniref:O-fucosyltransferase family protein n=1 Tax=Spirodela intermedia TaxID=51605 RepID=A0A7I8LFB8_SPIIN|nr:unnamed protein product [Spirodela intermedia]